MPILSIPVQLSGADLEQLLFNWIDEVIYRFDGGEKVAIGNDLEVHVDEGGDKIDGRDEGGEPYRPEKHGFRGTIVKAITYHLMRIDRNGLYKIQFVVDI